ncbi:AEC family transporter [Paramicrobacterium chengjingii]|uniref:AEC family transporter n=1 Tax=Paramicrobacterium chengjingii TaxID=2769067 RepID=A0ABX6YG25_9MICO|nr:AEC family transporter [Microbacterium chengjingii]QPZ37748.1 AEC family transporter [Microbacterium chengjingii]
MTGVLTGFAIIGVVIAVGFVAGRLQIGGATAGRSIQHLAFFIASPALLFDVLAHADVTLIFSSFISVALIAAVCAGGLFIVVNLLIWRRSVSEATIGALASGYVNANNIGLPVAVYVLGDAQFVAPIMLIQLIVFAPVALAVLDITGPGKVSLTSIVTQPVRNPIIIASAAGVVVAATGIQLPDAVYAPFELIGGAAVPLMLLAFGMSLSGQRPLRAGTGRTRVIVASLLKTAVMPLIAYTVARFVFGLDGDHLFAATVLAALPSAQNVFNYATRFETGEVFARDAVLLSTVLAVPSLIVIAALLA